MHPHIEYYGTPRRTKSIIYFFMFVDSPYLLSYIAPHIFNSKFSMRIPMLIIFPVVVGRLVDIGKNIHF